MPTREAPFEGESQVAVVMKHVRDALLDVQVKRRKVVAGNRSSAVDTATASITDVATPTTPSSSRWIW